MLTMHADLAWSACLELHHVHTVQHALHVGHCSRFTTLQSSLCRCAYLSSALVPGPAPLPALNAQLKYPIETELSTSTALSAGPGAHRRLPHACTASHTPPCRAQVRAPPLPAQGPSSVLPHSTPPRHGSSPSAPPGSSLALWASHAACLSCTGSCRAGFSSLGALRQAWGASWRPWPLGGTCPAS